jgi:integrase
MTGFGEISDGLVLALAAQLLDWHPGLSLLKKPDDLLFGESGRLHVRHSPKNGGLLYDHLVVRPAGGRSSAAYGTHSIRRTKASLIYRRTKNLRAVQLLLGHTKLESTMRYLGIEVDDALELAEQTEV